MRTRKTAKSQDEAAKPPIDIKVVELPSGNTSENETDSKKRISIGIGVEPDGTFNFESMREPTKESIRKLISDPGFAKEFGTTGAEAKPEEKQFTENFSNSLYDGVGFVMQTIAPRMGIDPEVAQEVLAFTPEQKEMLAGPTTETLNLIPIPPFVIKYQCVGVLVMMLGTIMSTKLEQAKDLTKKKQVAQTINVEKT
jgi:hypothetical protein